MSKQNLMLIIGLGTIAIALGFGVSFYMSKEHAGTPAAEVTAPAPDHKNLQYKINGESVLLVDGVAATAIAPGSASQITTQYFGNELVLDLDADGREDTVFILTQNDGGSGTFFYLAAALNREGGMVGSDALLLGDRIAPQNIQRGENNTVTVNYAVRASGEPMTAVPSVGVSEHFLFDAATMQFGEVVQDFEGEADPLFMSLPMKTWIWQETSLNDGTTVLPREPEAFSVTFNQDGSFTATTDCNGIGGQYRTDGALLTFSEMMSTLMYCDGSQEADFAGYLTNTSGYHFTTRGELILDLKFDSGSVVFR